MNRKRKVALAQRRQAALTARLDKVKQRKLGDAAPAAVAEPASVGSLDADTDADAEDVSEVDATMRLAEQQFVVRPRTVEELLSLYKNAGRSEGGAPAGEGRRRE